MAEHVPTSVNNMDVLNEYFGRFGPVSSLQVNHNRQEAVVTFARFEDAQEALKYPVLNDAEIKLRPWRSKGGQRQPEDVLHAHTSVSTTLGLGGIAAAAAKVSPHLQLESGKLLEKKKQKEELEEKRKFLLQGLTDQLKAVLTRISDPKTSDKNREQLQSLLTIIKDKMAALTPEPEAGRGRFGPLSRPVPTPQVFEPQRPMYLRLRDLPEALRTADSEARLRQTLGEGVEAFSGWTEDGSSCVARFSDRRSAEAAFMAQKVMGITAVWHTEEEMGEPAPPSPETEAMDSDIPDDELGDAMAAVSELVAQQAQEEQNRGQQEAPAESMEQESVPEPPEEAPPDYSGEGDGDNAAI